MCVCALLAVDACTQYITPCMPQCGDSALHSVSMHLNLTPLNFNLALFIGNYKIVQWLVGYLSLVHEETGSSLNIFFSLFMCSLYKTQHKERVCVCVTFIAHLLGRVLEVCTLH